MTGCRTGKKRHATEEEAQKSLKYINSRHRERAHLPVRFYPCSLCGGYHLTSSPGYTILKRLKLEAAFRKYLAPFDQTK